MSVSRTTINAELAEPAEPMLLCEFNGTAEAVPYEDAVCVAFKFNQQS